MVSEYLTKREKEAHKLWLKKEKKRIDNLKKQRKALRKGNITLYKKLMREMK